MHRAGLDYAFQVEWIRGRGLLLWIAMVLGALGGGAFLVSTVYSVWEGSLAGFLIAFVGKGSLHVAFLGRPERFWRAIRRPHSSWISRGLLFLGSFSVAAVVYVVLDRAAPGALATDIFRWASLVLAAMLVTYEGFLMAAATGIPFWNSSVLPILYGAAALLGGVGVSLLLLPNVTELADPTLDKIETIDRYTLLALAFLILSYLWTMYYTTGGARRSVLELVRGQLRAAFLGTCIVLVLVPASIVIYSLFNDISHTMLTVVGLMEVAGDFALKYLILRGGMYAPLIPRFVTPIETWMRL